MYTLLNNHRRWCLSVWCDSTNVHRYFYTRSQKKWWVTTWNVLTPRVYWGLFCVCTLLETVVMMWVHNSTKYATKVVSLWTFKAKFLRIISLNNRFLNIYEQCVIKMSFLSCKYKIKCIFNIFNFISQYMSTCWFCKWYEKCGLCWCTASLRWGQLVMIIIIKKAMLTCIWKQEANSCPDITSDVLLTLPSTDSLSLHFLLHAFSLNTIKRRLRGKLLEQPMPFIPHTPSDFLPDKL